MPSILCGLCAQTLSCFVLAQDVRCVRNRDLASKVTLPLAQLPSPQIQDTFSHSTLESLVSAQCQSFIDVLMSLKSKVPVLITFLYLFVADILPWKCNEFNDCGGHGSESSRTRMPLFKTSLLHSQQTMPNWTKDIEINEFKALLCKVWIWLSN